MVAYGFMEQFVPSIRQGLAPSDWPPTVTGPKLHTIRGPRRRHVRPGEKMQLFGKWRQRGCYLIGEARCIRFRPILLRLESYLIVIDYQRRSRADRTRLSTVQELMVFARADGFTDFYAMADFWKAQHANTNRFEGFLIEWEPLPK